MHPCAVSIAVAIALVTASPPATDGGATAPSATAPAPSTPAALGPDEVQLLNGGFVRGTLVEVTPEQRVVILPDGGTEPRTIPWEEIAKVERGKHDASARATSSDGADARERAAADPAAARDPLEEVPGPGRPRVRIELTRDRPIKLFEVNNEIVASGYNTSLYGMQFHSVCAAPCNRVVDGSRGQAFFLATSEGSMWTASRKFSLDDRVGEVTLRVKPGNSGLRIAGAVLLGIGLGALIGGAVLVVPKSFRTAGIGLLAGGAPLFAAGLPMLILGRTRYEIAP